MRKLVSLFLVSLLVVACSAPVTTPTPSPSAVNESFEIYFVMDSPKGFRLVSETREFLVTNQTRGEVFAKLIDGRLQPLDPDYTNLWGTGNQLLSYEVQAEVISVDLAPVKLNVGAEAEARAIEQLVWTITANEKVLPVQFTINGEPIETFAGHVDTSQPFLRSETYEVLNDVQIAYPNELEVVSNPVVVKGMACTFEANVVWELRLVDSADTLYLAGSTTAAAACPDRSAFEVELGELESGEYVIRVFEYSAKDGALSSTDDKRFSVE